MFGVREKLMKDDLDGFCSVGLVVRGRLTE